MLPRSVGLPERGLPRPLAPRATTVRLFQHQSRLPVLQAQERWPWRARSAISLRGMTARGGEEGAGASDKASHDPNIPCPGCNGRGKRWTTRGSFHRHLKAPGACKDVGDKFPESNQPMDETVVMNLRAAYPIRPAKRPRKKQTAEAEPELPPCDYCERHKAPTDPNEPLLKCVSYVPIANPRDADWFQIHKPKLCSRTVHLSCVRNAQADEYKGKVDLAAAERNVIGFCV